MEGYKPHEYCVLADKLDPYELVELEASMRRQGFLPQYKIVRFEGKILDGWSRYNAALVAGVDPVFEDFNGTREEALDYAYTSLFARRHIPKGQKAMIALRFEKQKAAAEQRPMRSHEEIADMAGVSKPIIAQAASVERRDHEVAGKIAQGEMSLSRGYRELARSVPEEDTDIKDNLADVWITRDKWKLVMARVQEIAERDVEPLMGRRGSECIVESLGSKVRSNGRVQLGKTFFQEFLDRIRMNMPHEAHKDCNGEGCDVCRGRGYLIAAEARARKESSRD